MDQALAARSKRKKAGKKVESMGRQEGEGLILRLPDFCKDRLDGTASGSKGFDDEEILIPWGFVDVVERSASAFSLAWSLLRPAGYAEDIQATSEDSPGCRLDLLPVRKSCVEVGAGS